MQNTGMYLAKCGGVQTVSYIRYSIQMVPPDREAMPFERAAGYKLLGRTMFVVGAGFSAYQGVQAYRRGDNAAAAKSGLDIAMGGVGLMGPVGATASVLYFGVDMTVGWDQLLRTASKTAPAHCTTQLMPLTSFLH